MSVPPYACAFVCSLITSYISDKCRARGPFALFWSVIAVIGYGMWLATTNTKVLYGALVLQVTGIYATAGLFGAWNGEGILQLFDGNALLTLRLVQPTTSRLLTRERLVSSLGEQKHHVSFRQQTMLTSDYAASSQPIWAVSFQPGSSQQPR